VGSQAVRTPTVEQGSVRDQSKSEVKTTYRSTQFGSQRLAESASVSPSTSGVSR